jgi:hypothetical protein
MGISVGRAELQSLGLWHRELFYLEQVEERPLPPYSVSAMQCNDMPDGFVKCSPHWYDPDRIKESAISFRAEMVCNAWERDVLPNRDAEEKWRAEALWGCSPWSLAEFLSPKVRKMLRLSRASAWRWFNLRHNDSVFGRVKFSRGKGVWIDVRERQSLRGVCVEGAEGVAAEEGWRACPPPLGLYTGRIL